MGLLFPSRPRLQAARIYAMRLLLLFAVGFCLRAQTGENVLLVVNRNVPLSRQIADYYRPRRSVPARNVCTIDTTGEEEIQWRVYEEQIERPIGDCLKNAGLVDRSEEHTAELQSPCNLV